MIRRGSEGRVSRSPVRRNCSPGARALITYLDTSPKAASEAVERALDEDRVQLEERRRPNSRNKFNVLIPWQEDDPDGIPFQGVHTSTTS